MTASIKLIGIGDGGKATLNQQTTEWIEQSDVLVAGERVLAFFDTYEGQKIVIKGGLKQVVEQIQAATGNIVVLASGDPLFYGIGQYLSNKMPLEIYPHVSSVQLAFARCQTSWQDAKVISLHGRSIKGLAQKMNGEKKVALLTDEVNSPNAIAQYLLDFGFHEYRAFVAENLEGAEERCRHFTLEEMKEAAFSPLNVVILIAQETPHVWPLGIEDEEFSQRKPDKGLITKKEIRVLSIQQLNVKPDSIIWDIGTCTGSMAIEAGRIAKEGAVYAIEKNEPDLANCLENQKKFRVDVTAIHGKAPERLDEFPNPDAVFLGGTGGNIRDLLTICSERLNEGGRIVLNATTIENLAKAVEIFKELGLHVHIIQAQIARSKPILDMTRFVPLNPIFIITASKGEN